MTRFGIGRVLQSGFLLDAGRLASGTLFAQLVLLAISPILTRVFSPADFGFFSLVMASTAMIAVFSTLRLETIIPTLRYSADALRMLQVMLLLSLLVAVVTAGFVALFRPQLELALSISPGDGGTLYFAPFLIVAFAFYAGLRAWCVRRGAFASVAKAQISRALVLAASWLSFGLSGLFHAPGAALAAGQAIGDFIFGGALFRALSNREIQVLKTPRLSRIRSTLNDHARLLWALVSSQSISVVHTRLPILAIATAYGPVHAGFYALAERVVGAPSALISTAIGDVFRQRAAKTWHAGKSFDQLMLRILMLTLAISVVPFTIAIFLAPAYTGIVFGEDWHDAGYTMAVLLFGALVAFNSNPLDKAPIIVGAHRYMVIWHGLRLAAELAAAACAVLGWLSYELYLLASVGARCVLYAVDTAACFMFARKS